jgi:hypothetical protein
MQTTRLAAEEFFRERSLDSRVSFEEHFVKANLLIQQGLADSLAALVRARMGVDAAWRP